MLNLKVTVENDKILIQGLQLASKGIPGAAGIGLMRITTGIFAEAYKNLSGGSRSKVKLFTTNKKTGKSKRSQLRGLTDLLTARPGSYPVPRVTDWLRESLAFVKPRQTKTTRGRTFSAGAYESIVYNAAEYASVIAQAQGSSAKYRARPFISDGVQTYDQGGRIVAVMDEELQKVIDQSGL